MTGAEPFFIGYGVLGVMFLLVLTGMLVTKGTHDREIKKSDAKDAVIEGLTDALRRLADREEAKRQVRHGDAE